MPLIAPIFKNTELQAHFEQDGFVLIPFLESVQVYALEQLFQSIQTQLPQTGFYSLSFWNDPILKSRICRHIMQVLDSPVKAHFAEIVPLGGTFLLKNTGNEGEMPLHQDWTVTDESQYCSASIWIPLTDTDAQNGAMSVVPGSHRFAQGLRSPTLPNPIGDSHLQTALRQRLQVLPMKAGEALIFNHALIHASPPNLSDKPRVAVTYGLLPFGAPLHYYHRPLPNAQVEKLRIGYDFFLNYPKPGSRPDNSQILQTFEWNTQEPLTVQDFETWKMQENALLNNKNKDKDNEQKSGIQQQKIKKNMLTNTPIPGSAYPFFRDDKTQQQFDEEGYAVVDLFEPEDVAELLQYYRQLTDAGYGGRGFHISMDRDADFTQRVAQKLMPIFERCTSRCFKDYKLFISSFVIKEHDTNAIVPPHQDWTFTDESTFASATVWAPLVDVDIDNGALGLIKGSHRFFDYIRHSPTQRFPSPFLQNQTATVFPYLNIVDMKAGQALVFNNKTIHASPPNVSGMTRIAVGVGIVHKDAPLLHYYALPNTQPAIIECFEVDKDAWVHLNGKATYALYESGKRPEGKGIKSRGTIALPRLQISSHELKQLIEAAGNRLNQTLIQKMATLPINPISEDGNGKPESAQSVYGAHSENAASKGHMDTAMGNKQTTSTSETFWQIYTPHRIAAEIKYRLQTKPQKTIALIMSLFLGFVVLLLRVLGRKK